jgi:sugar porter (SP) family MFS transporter
MSDAAAAPSRSGAKAFIYRVSAITALGGFLFGYDTGVISGALLYITPEFSLTKGGQQVVVAALLLGAVFGALAAGPLADAVGRRTSLIATAVVFAAGAVASGLAPGTGLLVASRFVIGLAIGAASLVVPLYIAEISPAERRGRLVSLNQLMITVGIFVSYLVGLALAAAEAWRWMLALAAVPAAAMLAGLFTLPESPRWLVNRDRVDQARDILARSRQPDQVDEEVREIEQQRQEEASTSWSDLRKPELRPAIAVGVGVAAINQLIGVNAIIYYAPTILTQTGFGDQAAILSSVGIGAVNVLVTIIALRLVDRAGRRPLILAGTAGCVLALLVLGALYLLPSQDGVVGYLIVAGLMVYIASFAASLGIAIWLLNAEVFPTAIRGKAGSLGTISHWGLDFVISLTVLTIIGLATETGLFWLYAAFGIAGLVFLHRRLPETKGRSLEEIDRSLRGQAST